MQVKLMRKSTMWRKGGVIDTLEMSPAEAPLVNDGISIEDRNYLVRTRIWHIPDSGAKVLFLFVVPA